MDRIMKVTDYKSLKELAQIYQNTRDCLECEYKNVHIHVYEQEDSLDEFGDKTYVVHAHDINNMNIKDGGEIDAHNIETAVNLFIKDLKYTFKDVFN